MKRVWILAAIAAVGLAGDAEAGCGRGGGRTRFFRLFNRGSPAGCQASARAQATVSYQAAPAAGCAFCPQRE